MHACTWSIGSSLLEEENKAKEMGNNGQSLSDNLLQALGDFTSKDKWDKFFTIRDNDDFFECYVEWPEFKDPFLSHLAK